MERLRVIPGGRSEFAPDGTQVRAKIVNPLEKGERPTGTPIHEITHAKIMQETGGTVYDASIIPDSDSNGRTRGANISGAARVGPHMTGQAGGGFDMYAAEILGQNTSSNAATAKSIFYEHEEGIAYVASLLQKRKTMTGGQIAEAFNRFNEGEIVIVEVKTPDGEVSEKELDQDSNVVTLFGRRQRIKERASETGIEHDLSDGVEVELAQAA